MINKYFCASANLRFLRNYTVFKLYLLPVTTIVTKKSITNEPSAYVFEFEPHR